MIYVVQENTSVNDYRVTYAGSSAHEALVEAGKLNSCRIRIFKKGKRIIVTDNTTKGLDNDA